MSVGIVKIRVGGKVSAHPLTKIAQATENIELSEAQDAVEVTDNRTYNNAVIDVFAAKLAGDVCGLSAYNMVLAAASVGFTVVRRPHCY